MTRPVRHPQDSDGPHHRTSFAPAPIRTVLLGQLDNHLVGVDDDQPHQPTASQVLATLSVLELKRLVRSFWPPVVRA